MHNICRNILYKTEKYSGFEEVKIDNQNIFQYNVGERGTNMEFSFDFIKAFTEHLGALLGPHCEIVVHDFTGDLEHTIVHIVNGQLSGREVGGCPTNLFFENLRSLPEKADRFSEYYTTTGDGRTIRSSTTFMTDASGKIVGSICVNLDITAAVGFAGTLQDLMGRGMQMPGGVGNERFARNVQELMDHYLEEAEQMIGKPAAQMDKSEKLRALAFLDDRGVLQISKAHVRLCEFFGISKYSLYNYLDEVRRETLPDGEEAQI